MRVTEKNIEKAYESLISRIDSGPMAVWLAYKDSMVRIKIDTPARLDSILRRKNAVMCDNNRVGIYAARPAYQQFEDDVLAAEQRCNPRADAA